MKNLGTEVAVSNENIQNFIIEKVRLLKKLTLLNQQSSEKNKLGSTSGLGFGLGYLGTIPVLLIVLYFFILSDTVLFDLNKQEFENIRFTALIVALWFLIFSIPILFFFKDKTSKDIKTNHLTTKSTNKLKILNELLAYPSETSTSVVYPPTDTISSQTKYLKSDDYYKLKYNKYMLFQIRNNKPISSSKN